MSRPLGPITTLLDLTNRDFQENDIFPLQTDETWFTRDTNRRLLPFTSSVQEIPFRGPAAFGQRFSFDLGSILVGDLLFGTAIQLRLNHWLDSQTRLLLEAGLIRSTDGSGAWEWANSLGTAIIQEAELEIDGQTIETIDGDFIDVFSRLFSDYNAQVGIAYDAAGRISLQRLHDLQVARVFPTEDGILHCVLPFFFMRTRYQDALPLVAIREGMVRIHVTLRPFDQCVRQLRGYRDSCTATPLGQTLSFAYVSDSAPRYSTTSVAPPDIQSVQLMTYGALVQGQLRQRMLHQPFEMVHREVQTFSFDEPLKYAVGSRSDAIRIQLPLEANHPLEEIVWFVRRKGVQDNNAWTNYSAYLESEWPGNDVVQANPLLVSAAVQINGITVCDAEEQYFRQLIAGAHKGGAAAYNAFLYGYPFARTPGQHQPSGSMNASRTNSLRLTLEVRPPGTDTWEVKVFCIGLNWMRFENGLANALFED
jgi:hypothetical protein